MIGKQKHTNQASMFNGLAEQLDQKHPLYILSHTCFTHFLKLCPESIDFAGLSFENGCPAIIFGDVFAKKEK